MISSTSMVWKSIVNRWIQNWTVLLYHSAWVIILLMGASISMVLLMKLNSTIKHWRVRKLQNSTAQEQPVSGKFSMNYTNTSRLFIQILQRMIWPSNMVLVIVMIYWYGYLTHLVVKSDPNTSLRRKWVMAPFR